jgi:hypothetical protein
VFLRLLPKGKRRVILELFVDKDFMARDGTPRSKREELARLVRDPGGFIEDCTRRDLAGRSGDAVQYDPSLSVFNRE